MSDIDRKVAIIGSGLIGRAWAIIFSSFNYQVQLFDTDKQLLAKATQMIANEVNQLCNDQQARGTLTYDQRMALIKTCDTLDECLEEVCHVQECVYENLPLKQDLFEQVDKLLAEENTLASICSSTSVHLPSLVFSKVVKHKDQCLVAHPINPPLHVRLVELVPSSETREEILIRCRIMFDQVGQKPVILNKEVSGFALNRLQNAVFQEAFRLVHDGIMSPDDVDTVVTEGLGPRYAFIGPWMTAHLNANGCGDFFEKYGPGIYQVSQDCQPLLRIEGEAAQLIIDEMTREVPLDKLAEKRSWRDKCLIELSKMKNNMNTR